MKLSQLAVKRPVTTIMMMMLVLILGFVSFTNLKLNLMPSMNPPVIAVMTTYPGTGPQEVNEMVTKPIEEVVGTSQGLKMMESRSSQNASLVIAQFEWGVNISEVREDLSTKLSLIPFSDGIGKPMIVKFDPTMMPILQFAVSSNEGIEEIQQLVNEEIIPSLQNIDGVANISVTGGFDEEISVEITNEILDQYDLTMDRIKQLIQANNMTFPGGVIKNEDKKLNMRIIGKVNSIDELKSLPISIDKQTLEVVTLSDIADVKLTKKGFTSIARNNGNESLMVNLQKEGSANTVEVSREVREKLDEFQRVYKNLTFTVSTDQGEVVEKSVSNVTLALLFGGIFAVGVILVFLRSISSTVIVGIAIPFSVISAFVFMYFSGITLNIMSMGGLALGVGMLVDNAIVVIENIYRHMTMEKSRKQAAIDGAVEVSGAVTASMLTTVAVFLPIVFVGGLVGELFKELALTVAFSLIASWLVALTVVPALAALLLNPKKTKVKKENRLYKNVISWALSNRLLTLLFAAIIFGVSVYSAKFVGTEFIPVQDEGMYTIDVSLPEGTTFSKTLAIVEKIEKEALNSKEVKNVTSKIGEGDPFRASMGGAGENKAQVTINLVDGNEREITTEQQMSKFREKLADIEAEANLTYNLSNSMEAMSGEAKAVEVLVVGSKENKVNEYAKELEHRLLQIDSIKQVENSIEVGKPEFQFVVDKEKAFKYGLTTVQVASHINKMLQGELVTKISTNGIEKNVKVSVKGIEQTKEGIENLLINSPVGMNVPLKEIGTVIEGQSPVTIVRENQNQAVTLSAKFEGTDMGSMTSAIQKEINNMEKELAIDTEQYTIKTGGGSEMMNESFASLQLAMILAIVFVYMVMASQFESFIHPLIIMFTLPLAVSGVIYGLLITGYAFGITAFIGIIVLIGIVVNNAIVFVDYTNQLIRSGSNVREALIKTGTTRIRPIVMTALTTMLGLLPLAVGTGEGSEMQAPMAVAVIGGLFTSTLLTLVVIPVVYSLFESLKRKGRKSRQVEAKG